MHLISPSTPSRNAHFSLPILSLTWLAAARLHLTSTTRPLGASNCGRYCLLSLLSSILNRRIIISVLLIPDSWADSTKRGEDAQKLLPQIGQSHSQSLVGEKKPVIPASSTPYLSVARKSCTLYGSSAAAAGLPKKLTGTAFYFPIRRPHIMLEVKQFETLPSIQKKIILWAFPLTLLIQ